MAVLELPAPLPGLQAKWLSDPCGRKVLPQGRRASKTGGCWIAALLGHGIDDVLAIDKPLPGLIQGGDVLWFAQDYPNLTKVVWDSRIEPTFRDQPFATLNENEHKLTIHGKGSLYLLSAEALDSARGLGDNVRGVIIDEAAHLDLQKALLRSVLPMLIDNNGWLILASSTNSGLDGNAQHRVPSYFNLICDEIEHGDRDGWVMYEGTVYDNPLLNTNAQAITEFIAEYANDPIARDEEVFALRLAPGGGSAFPMLTGYRDTYLVPERPLEPYWTLWGAFDWGYDHPWVFGLGAADESGNAYLVDSVSGREDLPDSIGAQIMGLVDRHGLSADRLYQIACGHDTWHQSKARGEATPSVAEQLAKKGLTKLVKANIDRLAGLNNMRWYLMRQDVEGRDMVPAFRLFDTPSNRMVYDCLTRMVRDPKHPEDVLKVNAVNGKGGDDAYDMVRYLLAARPYQAVKPESDVLDDINSPDVLTYEWTTKMRAGNVKAEGRGLKTPKRMLAETDPMFGDF